MSSKSFRQRYTTLESQRQQRYVAAGDTTFSKDDPSDNLRLLSSSCNTFNQPFEGIPGGILRSILLHIKCLALHVLIPPQGPRRPCKGFLWLRPAGWLFMVVAFLVSILFFAFLHLVMTMHARWTQQTLTCPDSPTHLIVLSHGWTGTPSNMDTLVGELERALSEKDCALIHKIHGNWGLFRSLLTTSVGIEIGSHRIAQEILAVKSAYPTLNKISFIGHSLGGLYMRYAATVLAFFDEQLEKRPVQERKGVQRLAGMAPEIFATFATPHAGIRNSLWSVTELIASFAFGEWRPKIADIRRFHLRLLHLKNEGRSMGFLDLLKFIYYRLWSSIDFGRTYFQLAMHDHLYIDYAKKIQGLPALNAQKTWFSLTAFWLKQPQERLASKRLQFPLITELVSQKDRAQIARGTSRPLLAMMADKESLFVKVLASFQHRVAYTSLSGDFFVPCASALITHVCPDINHVFRAGLDSQLEVLDSSVDLSKWGFSGRFFFHRLGGPFEANKAFATDRFAFVREAGSARLLPSVESFNKRLYRIWGEPLINFLRGKYLCGEQEYKEDTEEHDIILELNAIGWHRGGSLWSSVFASFFSHGFTIYGFRSWAYLVSGRDPVCPSHLARAFFSTSV